MSHSELENKKSDYAALVDYILHTAREQGCDAAQAGVSALEGLSVTVRMGSTEELSFHCAQSVAITVYKNKAKASASLSDLSKPAIHAAIQQAAFFASQTEPEPWAGLAEDHDLALGEHADLDLDHPWDLSPEQAIEMALSCEEQALAHDPRLVNSEGASIHCNRSLFWMGNSAGFFGGYAQTQHSMSCTLIAKDADKMQQDTAYTLHRAPAALRSIPALAEEVAQKTLARLGSRSCPTQSLPVIFDAPLACGLISHMVSALSGGAQYRKASFLLDAQGHQVLPSWLSLYEDPFILQGLGSTPFDSEGVLPRKRFLVEQGHVQGYVLNAYAARRLGLKNTGNAGGIHNLLLQSQDLQRVYALKDLFKQMDRGIWITELMGSGVNGITGDYSRGAAGFWIEHGEIQYPVEELTIAGNLKEMYQNIVALGSDCEKRSLIQSGSLFIDRMMIAGSR